SRKSRFPSAPRSAGVAPVAKDLPRAVIEHLTPPLGAVSEGGRASFRVWSPDARRIGVLVEGPERRRIDLRRAADGYFQATGEAVARGTRYRYLVDDEGPWPDPCSRFQPDGPHGASLLVDRAAFRWTDEAWRGLSFESQVLYELHVGTFTPRGSFDAAAE